MKWLDCGTLEGLYDVVQYSEDLSFSFWDRAEKNNLELLKRLEPKLSKINVNILGGDQSPLDLAIGHKNLEMIEWLSSLGAIPCSSMEELRTLFPELVQNVKFDSSLSRDFWNKAKENKLLEMKEMLDGPDPICINVVRIPAEDFN